MLKIIDNPLRKNHKSLKIDNPITKKSQNKPIAHINKSIIFFDSNYPMVNNLNN